MRRRSFLAFGSAGLAVALSRGQRSAATFDFGCGFAHLLGGVVPMAWLACVEPLQDIRGKALGVPVYRLLGGPLDSRGVRGYYHADGVRTPEALKKLRETAIQQGVSCFKTGLPTYYEWIETRKKISAAVKSMQ